MLLEIISSLMKIYANIYQPNLSFPDLEEICRHWIKKSIGKLIKNGFFHYGSSGYFYWH